MGLGSRCNQPRIGQEGAMGIHAVKSYRQTEKEPEVREALVVGSHLANQKLARE